MKVLVEGKSWTIKKTCKGCGAVLEIEPTDISYEITDSDISSQQYNEDIEGTFSVNCPSCGQFIGFRKNEIPAPIKERIKTGE